MKITRIDDIGKIYAEKVDCIWVEEQILENLPIIDHLTNLQILIVCQNKLTHVPSFPQKLKSIGLFMNRLTTLPDIPPTATDISFSRNRLTSIHFHINHPYEFVCSRINNNRLRSLPEKLTTFVVDKNPFPKWLNYKKLMLL